MPFELFIAEGAGRGRRFDFHAPEVAIGRDAANDLVLEDAGVSRAHARIRARGAGYVLSDHGSTNGTVLNGALVEGSAPLRDGDRIGVGALALEFVGRPPPRRLRSRPGRAAAGLFACALLACAVPIVRGAVRARAPAGPPFARPVPARACPRVVAVDGSTARLSFGHGAVDFDCEQAVSFDIEVPAGARARFHYLPRGFEEADDLELAVNGHRLSATVPATTVGGEGRAVAIPGAFLGAGGRAVLTATAARAGREWSLSGVRVEILPGAPATLKSALESYDRGRRKLAERKVAPRNLYDAWRYFGKARAGLEELDPKPDLHAEVVKLEADARRDLEKSCARHLFSAARDEKYGQVEKAQLTYREVLLRFPGADPSGCRRRAQENLVAPATGDDG